MRATLTLAAVAALSAMVFFYGCEKETRTLTVTTTISHFYFNVPIDNASDGILSYSCFDGDNMGVFWPHYGSISVGTMDTYSAQGNEMDFGFLTFDLGNLELPNGAELTELSIHLNSLMAVENGMNIFITLQDAPVDNSYEMIDRICSGTLLAQDVAENEGFISFQVDPGAVTLHGGKLYLGVYSDAAYGDWKLAFFDAATSYARVRYTTQE